MKRHLGAVALAVLPLLASASGAQEPEEPRFEAAARQATEALQALKESRAIPGLSVAVGLDGQVIWTQTLGFADLDLQEPITVHSVFPLGSTTKTLTSIALGKLVEEGKLNLDAPIQEYVPYFPTKKFPLTARLLASHLSGLRDYDMMAGEYANTKHFASVREAVAVFVESPLLFEPGTDYHYSAYNYVLLSAAMEGAVGMDFLSYLQATVIKPLGLTRTGPILQDASTPDLVTGYTSGFFGRLEKAPFTDLSNKWAAGGFRSTPTEMVRIGNALLEGRVVSRKTFDLLTTPQRLSDGSPTGEPYALGWRSETRRFPGLARDVRMVHHGGLGNGSISFFVLFPDDGLVLSILGNRLFRPASEFFVTAFEIADLFLQEADEVPLTAQEVAKSTD